METSVIIYICVGIGILIGFVLLSLWWKRNKSSKKNEDSDLISAEKGENHPESSISVIGTNKLQNSAGIELKISNVNEIIDKKASRLANETDIDKLKLKAQLKQFRDNAAKSSNSEKLLPRHVPISVIVPANPQTTKSPILAPEKQNKHTLIESPLYSTTVTANSGRFTGDQLKSHIRAKPKKSQTQQGVVQQGHESPRTWHQKQRQKYHRNCEERLVRIRDIQEQHVVSPEQLKSVNCDLLICVDARPKAIGGYCIDLKSKSCDFYSYSSSVLPWELKDKSICGNSGEFEMKNLLFALLLWESKILNCKSVHIHTDNQAILINETNEYGHRVQAFIRHFRLCKGIKIHYRVTNLRRNSGYPDFARYIQPADDLSRNNVFEAILYLHGIYSIAEFCGAYEDSASMENYNEFLMTVKRSVRRWYRHPCSCGFEIHYTESLRMRS